MMMLRCFTLTFFFLKVAGLESFVPVTKAYPDCDNWAREGECLKNPNFMWSSCHTSCMELAKDDNESCPQWASEGECSNNPKYIQLHCPVSCSKATGWNVWQRQIVGLTDPLPTAELPDEPIASDVISAAELMKNRILTYLHGGASFTPGFSSAAPSEYLGMMGIAESFLYTFRLYAAIIYTELPLRPKENNEKVFEKLSIVDRNIDDRFKRILAVIGSGYSSDTLMRSFFEWAKYLLDTSAEVNEIISDIKAADPNYVNVGFKAVTKIFNPQTRDGDVPHYAADVVVNKNHVLPFGVDMPNIGLGTWQLEGGDCELAVLDAITAGYRHIDTAQAYGNEISVGWGIKHAIDNQVVKRADLFIATKISDERSYGYNQTKDLLMKQLKDLQIEYVDLYILHSPIRNKKLQEHTWRAMELLYDGGWARSIGVSNFNHDELRQLNNMAKVKPMVIQNKADVYHVGKQLDSEGDRIVEFSQRYKVRFVSYSSFSAYPFVMSPLADPIVQHIARNHITVSTSTDASTGTGTVSTAATPGQVILRWLLQHNFSVIPRSTSKERLQENIDTLSISPLNSDEMKLLDSLQFLVESPVSVAVPITKSEY